MNKKAKKKEIKIVFEYIVIYFLYIFYLIYLNII